MRAPRNPLSIRLVDGGHAQRLEVLADDPETVTAGTISLRWNATAGADAWRVQHVRAGIGAETWSPWVAASGPGRTHVITGLTENAPYNVRVEAVNGAVGSLNVRAGYQSTDSPGPGGTSSGGNRDMMATYDTDGTYGLTCSEAAAGGLQLPARYVVAPGSYDNHRTAAIHRWLGEGKADYDTFGGPLCEHMPRERLRPLRRGVRPRDGRLRPVRRGELRRGSTRRPRTDAGAGAAGGGRGGARRAARRSRDPAASPLLPDSPVIRTGPVIPPAGPPSRPGSPPGR